MDKEQLIQKYITNRLSKADKLNVEHLLKSDAEFKQFFNSHKDITMAYKLAEANTLKAHFKQLEHKKTKTKRLGRFKFAYLAIASILVIGLFYTLNSKDSGTDLYNSNFTIYPNTYQPVTRSAEQDVNLDAFVAYENNNFKSAQIAFETLLKTDSNNTNLTFYYALSLLNQSQFSLALEQFKTLNAINHDYKAEALWYTTLIYLQQEDLKNAKTTLGTLDSLNSAFKSQEREVLLRKLD